VNAQRPPKTLLTLGTRVYDEICIIHMMLYININIATSELPLPTPIMILKAKGKGQPSAASSKSSGGPTLQGMSIFFRN
jgi:hypothetical protein